MSENPAPAAKPRPGLLTWALWGAALIGVAAVVYIMAQSLANPPAATPPKVADVPVAAKAFADKVSRPTEPTPAPDYAFNDEAGKPLKVADLKGKVVVLNVWATWCGPCKVEMPTLAKLAESYKGQPVVVAPVSIDTAEEAAKAKLFIASNSPLKFFHDPEMKLLFRINGQGAPTTVIYGKDGMEKMRVSGDIDWSSPEAHALIDEALKG